MFEVHRVVDAKNLLVNCSTNHVSRKNRQDVHSSRKNTFNMKKMFKDVKSVYLFVN